jgi:hypothetical protein
MLNHFPTEVIASKYSMEKQLLSLKKCSREYGWPAETSQPYSVKEKQHRR